MARLGVPPHVADKILNVRQVPFQEWLPSINGMNFWLSARMPWTDGARMLPI